MNLQYLTASTILNNYIFDETDPKLLVDTMLNILSKSTSIIDNQMIGTNNKIREYNSDFLKMVYFLEYSIYTHDIDISVSFLYKIIEAIFTHETMLHNDHHHRNNELVEDRGHFGLSDSISESIIDEDVVSNIISYYIYEYDGPLPKLVTYYGTSISNFITNNFTDEIVTKLIESESSFYISNMSMYYRIVNDNGVFLELSKFYDEDDRETFLRKEITGCHTLEIYHKTFTNYIRIDDRYYKVHENNDDDDYKYPELIEISEEKFNNIETVCEFGYYRC